MIYVYTERLEVVALKHARILTHMNNNTFIKDEESYYLECNDGYEVMDSTDDYIRRGKGKVKVFQRKNSKGSFVDLVENVEHTTLKCGEGKLRLCTCQFYLHLLLLNITPLK